MQEKNTKDDMSDSYKLMAAAVNELQFKVGRLEGRVDDLHDSQSTMTHTIQVQDDTGKTHNLEVRGPQHSEEDGASSASGVMAPEEDAGLLLLMADPVFVTGTITAAAKAAPHIVPESLDEALGQARSAK